MKYFYWTVIIGLFSLFCFALAACGSTGSGEPTSTQPVPIPPTSTPTASPIIEPTLTATAISGGDTTGIATPDLRGANLLVNVASALPGEKVTLNGAGYPAGVVAQIGIGPIGSEYEIIGTAQVDGNGRFTTQIAVPDYVTPGEEWVFVADVNNGKVIADPILIVGDDGATAVPASGVNEPVNGQFTRTNIFLIALEDAGQSGDMIGCNDSVIPVAVEIEPTIAPLTAALETLLSLDEQYYGQSGLYNALYQSALQVEGVNIDNGKAVIHLTGDLQLGGVCDNPRVQAQLEQTARQYETVNAVAITVNGVPLESLLSGQ